LLLTVTANSVDVGLPGTSRIRRFTAHHPEQADQQLAAKLEASHRVRCRQTRATIATGRSSVR